MRLIDCFAEIMAFTVDFLKNAAAGEATCESMAERYHALVGRAREECAKGRLPEADWNEALFAVSCWADESILTSDWPEKAKWPGHQLQHRYFGTTNGGDEFFTHLEALPEEAHDVKEVYGSCLAMGFKGRFFDPGEQKGLSELTKLNFDAVQADKGFVNRLFLFPAAYGVQASRRQRSFGIYAVMFFAAVLPVAAFAVLYFFYGKILDRMVFQYFH